MPRDHLRVFWKVAFKSTRQPEKKKIRHSLRLRFFNHREHTAIGSVNTCSPGSPFLILWITRGKTGTSQNFPIVFHPVDDAHLVTILQIRTDSRTIDPYLDS